MKNLNLCQPEVSITVGGATRNRPMTRMTTIAALSGNWMGFVRRFRIATTKVLAALLALVAAVSVHYWPEDSIVDFAFEISGLILVLACLIGRSWCTLYIAGRKTRQLVTEGPYALCRNPLYFFSFLGAVGVAAGTETVTFVALVALLFAFYYPSVIRHEETTLRQLHGPAFDVYCQQVPSFFPRWRALRQFQETDALVVNPRLFRKTLFSVIWFIIAFLLVHSFEWLHEIRLLPVYFNIF